MGAKMLEQIAGFYVFQMYMPHQQSWWDIKEFSDFSEGAKWVESARSMDRETQFRLVRVCR